METFVVHQGVAAPLLRANIDTDAIIPSREMKFVSKTGLAGGLFAGWRYLDAWDALPPTEVTNTAIHFTPAGSRTLADLLAPAILQIAR